MAQRGMNNRNTGRNGQIRRRRRNEQDFRRQLAIAGMITGLCVVVLGVIVFLMMNLTDKTPDNYPQGSVAYNPGKSPEPTAVPSLSQSTPVPQSQSTATPQPTETPRATSTPQPTPGASSGNPMSRHEIHQGQWDLAALDNTESGFGYAEKNRAENMVPTDWSFYENKWGQYNVDWIQDINSNTIYLTMDVGFANDYTEGIIDTLRDKNVQVVFFITKMFFDESPSTVQRMLDEGHIVGNHTCNHPNMPAAGIEKETAEIMDLWNAMHDKFDYEMKLFRFPEGRFSDQSLALVENLGFKSVFWSYAYNDYSNVQPEVEPSYKKAVEYLHPGAIYLLHASSSTNAAFLGDFIDAARAAGYEFGSYPLGAN